MSGEPWLGNGPDSVPEAAWRAPMADNWRPPRGPRAKVIVPRPDEHAAMLSASATLLSTTPGCLSSTALVRQGLRQIRAAGLDRGPAPRHIVNTGPGRIAAHRPDPGGLAAVRENAMRFWRQQENPLSLLGSAPKPKPLPVRPLYACMPLPPARVFALARTGPWSAPAQPAPPRVVGAILKRHQPALALEDRLASVPVPLHRDPRHPLGLISLHGVPLLERNICQGDRPWPSRTSTSVVHDTVARAIALKQARDRSNEGAPWRSTTAPPCAHDTRPDSPDSGLSIGSGDEELRSDEALCAQAAACARQIAARRKECPDMARLEDLLRGLIPTPSARCPHPPHHYPTRPQKRELHPYGIHRALIGLRR